MSRLPKVLVVGSGWMLGGDFMASQYQKWELSGLTSRELDIRDVTAVERAVRAHNPDFVLNCAAYTKVDDAEDVGRKDNFDVNALGAYHLAKACRAIGCGFATISTDYVFDGTKEGGYLPEDEPNPVNAYGMAKYLWERLVRDICPNAVVIRTSWLYGGNADSKHFVNTMLRLGRTKPEIRVIADQFWAPTNTLDLCEAISGVFSSYGQYAGKILHFSNETENPNGISWYEFAKFILVSANIDTPVIPISTEEYPTKARRPGRSRLSGGIPNLNWGNGVSLYLKTYACEK